MYLSKIMTSAVVCTTLLATTSFGQAVEIVSDGADRIRLAGQLPMLTQQVAAASCSITSGVDVAEAHDVLERALAEFDRYIVALRDGDAELHILQPEERRRTLVNLDHVETEWHAIHHAVESVLADGSDVDSSHIIDDHNMKLLELTTLFASDIANQYAIPFELSAADILSLEWAGRQRMLTQKMAKDACEIWTVYHAEEAKEDLRSTMGVFENSLNALRYGMAAAGIKPASNDVIVADLDDLLTRWSGLKPNLTTLVEGGELNEEQKHEVFHDLEVELIALDHLLDDYKEYAERAH